ncbi:MAG: hypothetical protein DWQ07_05515 [Chloroflexi bacterium]|nr:MAG: hypothetical protein DWQ07_05515 [Chloroflexota bacterium]MBL1194889.1 hypothetical protein [Chloroflexota bacterium]NOH12180.1 hypothetical protein [Chloroflexota bacterium]
MSSFFQQIYTLLTTNPGNLAYHLILIFALFGGLQITYSRWQSNKDESTRRLLLGFALLLAVRVLLFLVSGLSWQGLISTSQVLAPLDRAVDVVSAALIIWLWAFPEPKRLGDTGVLISSALFSVLGLFSIILTINSGNPFTGSWLDVIWVILAILLLIGGVAYLVLRKPDSWSVGLTMLVVLFLGHIFHLLNLGSGNEFPGSIRLAQIIAYPLLFTLAQRFATTEYIAPAPIFIEEKPEEQKEQEEEIEVEEEGQPAEVEPEKAIERVVPAGELAKYLALATSDDPQVVCQTLSEILARNLVADLSILLTPDASGGYLIQCGYDLIKEEPIQGAYLDATTAPDLTEALSNNQPFLRKAERAKHSLSGLAKALDLVETGSVLAIPISEGDNEFAAAIVLISPFSNHTWTFEDQQLLIQSSDALAELLLGKEESSPPTDINEAISSIAEIEELEEKNLALQAQVDALLTKDVDEPTVQGQENVESVVVAYEETKENLKKIYAENQELRQALRDALDEMQPDPNVSTAKAPEKSTGEIKLAGELKLALQEIANLQGVVTNANDKITVLETQSQNNGTMPSEQAEVIASISQELRQPMSSIIGYTDLLLNESVGILGALQRKFLDRVKSSTERMNSLVDDLIQIAALDSGSTELNPELVNLSAVIDDTLNVTSNQLREKNIVLRVDVPEQLPKLHTDKDAVQQIMMHLVQNAGAASPIEGGITLRALVQREHQTEDFVLIQVTDSGGGIPEEDLPRVFSRLYRADNPLIEGVGDTGVGLSIAKTLTEALGGSIWVDSNMGEGATFSVLLPVSREGMEIEDEEEADEAEGVAVE